MCARIAQMALAALFVYLTVTVAAFVYLDWWQAILVSLATLLLMVFAARLLIKSAVGRIGDLAKEMFRTKSRVLEGATIEVHTVKSIEPPTAIVDQMRSTAQEEENYADEEDESDEPRAGLRPVEQFEETLRNSHWYEVEVTIFPNPASAGPMTHWDVDDLRLVPSDAVVENVFDDDGESEESGPEFDLHELRIGTEGRTAELDEGSKFQGPQRLRFVTRVDRAVKELKFRYYFEQFGLIRLPQTLPS